MKTAICISGEARCFDDPWLAKTFREHLDGDVFISTWTHRGGSYNCGEQSSVFDAREPDPGLLKRLLQHYPNVKAAEAEDYGEWVENLTPTIRQIMSTKVSFAVTAPAQLYKIHRANELKREHEELHGRYDCVMRVRFDLAFLQKPPMDDLSVVNHVNYGISGAYWPNRVYDAFFYSSSEVMDRVSETWNLLDLNVNHPFENQLEKVDCCRLLYVTCLQYCIPVLDLQEPVCGVYRGQGEETFRKDMKYCYG